VSVAWVAYVTTAIAVVIALSRSRSLLPPVPRTPTLLHPHTSVSSSIASHKSFPTHTRTPSALCPPSPPLPFRVHLTSVSAVLCRRTCRSSAGASDARVVEDGEGHGPRKELFQLLGTQATVTYSEWVSGCGEVSGDDGKPLLRGRFLQWATPGCKVSTSRRRCVVLVVCVCGMGNGMECWGAVCNGAAAIARVCLAHLSPPSPSSAPHSFWRDPCLSLLPFWPVTFDFYPVAAHHCACPY
jgi:hypothetical protein